MASAGLCGTVGEAEIAEYSRFCTSREGVPLLWRFICSARVLAGAGSLIGWHAVVVGADGDVASGGCPVDYCAFTQLVGVLPSRSSSQTDSRLIWRGASAASIES